MTRKEQWKKEFRAARFLTGRQPVWFSASQRNARERFFSRLKYAAQYRLSGQKYDARECLRLARSSASVMKRIPI